MGENKETKNGETVKEYIAVISFGIACLVFVLRGMWYFYYSGYFRAFNIDRCYLAVNTDNTLYSIIGLLGIVIVWFALNYWFYISWKNEKIKILIVTILFEIVALMYVICIKAHFDRNDLVVFFKK